MLRNQTVPWSPWRKSGPGSVTFRSISLPVATLHSTASWIFLPLRMTVILLPMMVASQVCHSPPGLLANSLGAVWL